MARGRPQSRSPHDSRSKKKSANKQQATSTFTFFRDDDVACIRKIYETVRKFKAEIEEEARKERKSLARRSSRRSSAVATTFLSKRESTKAMNARESSNIVSPPTFPKAARHRESTIDVKKRETTKVSRTTQHQAPQMLLPIHQDTEEDDELSPEISEQMSARITARKSFAPKYTSPSHRFRKIGWLVVRACEKVNQKRTKEQLQVLREKIALRYKLEAALRGLPDLCQQSFLLLDSKLHTAHCERIEKRTLKLLESAAQSITIADAKHHIVVESFKYVVDAAIDLGPIVGEARAITPKLLDMAGFLNAASSENEPISILDPRVMDAVDYFEKANYLSSKWLAATHVIQDGAKEAMLWNIPSCEHGHELTSRTINALVPCVFCKQVMSGMSKSWECTVCTLYFVCLPCANQGVEATKKDWFRHVQPHFDFDTAIRTLDSALRAANVDPRTFRTQLAERGVTRQRRPSVLSDGDGEEWDDSSEEGDACVLIVSNLPSTANPGYLKHVCEQEVGHEVDVQAIVNQASDAHLGLIRVQLTNPSEVDKVSKLLSHKQVMGQPLEAHKLNESEGDFVPVAFSRFHPKTTTEELVSRCKGCVGRDGVVCGSMVPSPGGASANDFPMAVLLFRTLADAEKAVARFNGAFFRGTAMKACLLDMGEVEEASPKPEICPAWEQTVASNGISNWHYLCDAQPVRQEHIKLALGAPGVCQNSEVGTASAGNSATPHRRRAIGLEIETVRRHREQFQRPHSSAGTAPKEEVGLRVRQKALAERRKVTMVEADQLARRFVLQSLPEATSSLVGYMVAPTAPYKGSGALDAQVWQAAMRKWRAQLVKNERPREEHEQDGGLTARLTPASDFLDTDFDASDFSNDNWSAGGAFLTDGAYEFYGQYVRSRDNGATPASVAPTPCATDRRGAASAPLCRGTAREAGAAAARTEVASNASAVVPRPPSSRPPIWRPTRRQSGTASAPADVYCEPGQEASWPRELPQHMGSARVTPCGLRPRTGDYWSRDRLHQSACFMRGKTFSPKDLELEPAVSRDEALSISNPEALKVRPATVAKILKGCKRYNEMPSDEAIPWHPGFM